MLFLPGLACPRARAVEGLKRRRRTDSSGVSRARILRSLASFAVCCPWKGAIVGSGPCDYILCLTTYRVYARNSSASLIEGRFLEPILKAGGGVASCGGGL